MERYLDENLNPSINKIASGSNQGFLNESLFHPDILAIRNDLLTDSYTIEQRPFARGKFATVRRCRHKTTGQDFAAKCIRKRRRAQDCRHEILHEICVLKLMEVDGRQLKRIVRLVEVFETATEITLILELLSGGELQRLIDDEEELDEDDAIRFVRQTLEGLSYLHEKNIAHLDIKPQNILLTSSFPQCEVKLCDFGISRVITKGIEIREIVGTPDYVAPEVLQYEPISLATDMWSVGILAYVLLSGHTPFGGDSKQETFCNITNGQLDFPKDIFEDVSHHAKDFIRKLLVRAPCERMTIVDCLQHPWLNPSQMEPPCLPLTKSPTLILSDNSKETTETNSMTFKPMQDKTNFDQEKNNFLRSMVHPIPDNNLNLNSLLPDMVVTCEQNDQEIKENERNNSFVNKNEEELNEDCSELNKNCPESNENCPELNEIGPEVNEASENDQTDDSVPVVHLKSDVLVEDSTDISHPPVQNIAIVPLEAVVEEIRESSPCLRLLELESEESSRSVHFGNSVVGSYHFHHSSSLHTSSAPTTMERQTMKTKSEMVEFEGLTLSKRLIFSDEILVDERMGMVF